MVIRTACSRHACITMLDDYIMPPFLSDGCVMSTPALSAQDQLKKAVAQMAVDYVVPKLKQDIIVGIGTGSTANFFIDLLAQHKGKIYGTVASSEASAQRLKSHGIPV